MSGERDEFRVDFVGIGAFKSGTTWLAACLREHPQICMARGKETNFFTVRHVAFNLPVQGRYYQQAHYEEGIDWYKLRFRHRRPGQILGEYSGNYLGDPESPRLLWEHNPQAKLIACYRNPVDAIYSGYHQVSKTQPIHDPIEALIDKHPEFVNYFRYFRNTTRWLQRFPREQMLLLLFEDLHKDPGAVYKQVCRFLGVDDNLRPPSLYARVNERKVIRYEWVRDVRCRISALLGRYPFTRRLRTTLVKLGVVGLGNRLFRLNEKPGSYEPMPAEIRARLAEMFREDNRRLGGLLSRDLSHWQ